MALHNYWKRAATFIKETEKTSYLRAGRSVRQRVQLHLKQQFKTVDEAENATGLTVENYLDIDNNKKAKLLLRGRF